MSTSTCVTPDQLQKAICEESFYDFTRCAWPFVESAPFIDNWHIGAICEHLQAVTTGQIPKLLINIPPGCSKSLLTCVFWPMWEWTKNPSVRWFFASYDQRLSTRDSVKCRALFKSRWYSHFWGENFSIVHDQNQKTYFETTRGGYRLATSVGGHGTGEHPDRIVYDDPHSVKQAESEVERQSVLDWHDLTMSSRGVSREARRVIIMQRLNQRDLAGHVLAQGGWCHICLCMRHEYERMPDTPLGWNDPREEEAELLTPHQFDEGKVSDLEKILGRYGTAGQLQQRPEPRGGAMFKPQWFSNRVRAAPHHVKKRIRFWDRAATQDGGCYTAGVLLALDKEDRYFVEDVVHGQWEPNERNDRIVATALRDRTRFGPKDDPTIYIEAETGSTGKESFQRIASRLAGFRIKEDRPSGSKDVRAEPWADMLASGNVFLVENGCWDLENFVREHVAFRPAPGKRLGKYCDQVDSAAAAFVLLSKGRQAQGAFRVFTFKGPKAKGVKLLVCTRDYLEYVEITDHPSLLILIQDPPIPSATPPESPRINDLPRKGNPPLPSPDLPSGSILGGPPHGLRKLQDTLTLSFADLDPSQHQDTWEEPVLPWGLPCKDVMMTPDMGKKLWFFLTKRRDPSPDVWVIAGSRSIREETSLSGDDQRALSLAQGICDVLRFPRKDSIYCPEGEESPDNRETQGEPGNSHVYDVVKTSRHLVM